MNLPSKNGKGKGERPNTLEPKLENIPADLKKQNAWVAWRMELRNGKWTKPPVCVHTGRGAKSTDSQTWTNFDKAVEFYQSHQRIDGIGICIEESDLIGIDVDHCRNPKTGTLNEAGQKAVELFETYFEVSPSGTGIRGFCSGKFPKGLMNRNGPNEWYDKGRYLTVTGHAINNLEIRKIDVEELFKIGSQIFPERRKKKTKKDVDSFDSMDWGRELFEAFPPMNFEALTLTDQEVIEKAKRSKTGREFSMLMDGDYIPLGLCKDPQNPKGQHESDLSLCTRLAWWTNGNRAQIDRIFRASGMYRPKWDELRGETTYGEQTIEIAVNQCEGGYGQGIQMHEPRNDEELKYAKAMRKIREACPEEAMAILGKPNQAEGQSLLTEFGIHRVERHEVPRQPEETRFKLQVGDQNRLTRGLDIWELAQWKTVRSALMQACPTATFPSDWKFRKDKNQDWDQVYETICGLAETVVADKEASKWAAIEEEVIEYLEGASEWNPDHSIDPKNAKFPLISDMNGQWFYFAKLKGLQHVVKDSVKDASRKEIIDVLRDLGGETTVQPRLPVVDPKDQKSRRLPTRGNVWLIPKDRVEQ